MGNINCSAQSKDYQSIDRQKNSPAVSNSLVPSSFSNQKLIER